MITTHRIVHGDARRLEGVQDESVHLIVTSPPYPLIQMWDEQLGSAAPGFTEALDAGDGPGAFRLIHDLFDTVWRRCLAVLAPGGFLCINVGDAVRTTGKEFRLYPNHARVLTALQAMDMITLPLVLWRKPTNAPTKFMGSGMLPGGAYVTLEHEYIIVARKRGTRPLAGGEDQNSGRARRRRSAIFWEERNSWFSDLWELAGARQGEAGYGRARTAAFPLEIPFRLVAMYSWESDLVLDPFAGTGTTSLAAAALGRNSIAVDSEADAVSGAVRRMLAEHSREEARGRQEDRLIFHEEALRTRASVSHENAHYGIPVVTSQERELRLWKLAKISWKGEASGLLEAEHEDVRR